ncbi:hypothetical protein Tco_0449514 [Tanacetum coccineum]
MAFWGVYLKPNEPYTLHYHDDAVPKRLRVTQERATHKYPWKLSSYLFTRANMEPGSPKDNVNGDAISESVENAVIEPVRVAKIHDFCFGIPYGSKLRFPFIGTNWYAKQEAIASLNNTHKTLWTGIYESGSKCTAVDEPENKLKTNTSFVIHVP